MYIHDFDMDISVTEFRARCLELVHRVESGGGPVDIKRRGKVVARLACAPAVAEARQKPWERLRGTGKLTGAPEASVLHARDFEAAR
jgi:antitoxin (DNA-binding transcriptional repressor) of toxin-antitoxin stability system